MYVGCMLSHINKAMCRRKQRAMSVKWGRGYDMLAIRDQLIWQIEEYLYPTSILGMIYHIRADAFIFFGL